MVEGYPNLFAYLAGLAPQQLADPDVVQRPVVRLEATAPRVPPGVRGLGTEAWELLPPHVRGPEFLRQGALHRLHLASGRELDVRDRWVDCEQDGLEEAFWEQLPAAAANRIPGALRLLVKVLERVREAPAFDAVCAQLSNPTALAREAQEPLIVGMERQTRAALRHLSTRLTRHLRREARMQHLSRVQEVDAYCLRHLMRRPGLTTVEKAGPRQEVMAIHRVESHDAWENRFVKAFGKMLEDECNRYRAQGATQHLQTVTAFHHGLNAMLEGPLLEVRAMAAGAVRLNNVLLRRSDYNRIYMAYRDFLARKRLITMLWPHRVQLLVDWVYVCLAEALTRLQGAAFWEDEVPRPAESPDEGRFLPPDALTRIRLVVDAHGYTIRLQRSHGDVRDGDLRLVVTRERIDAPLDDDEASKTWQVAVWVFWGPPSLQTLREALHYLESRGGRGWIVHATDDVGSRWASLKGPLRVIPFVYARDEEAEDAMKTPGFMRGFAMAIAGALKQEVRGVA
jgi:hypothetical protein